MAKLKLKSQRRQENTKILIIAAIALVVLAGLIALTVFVIIPAFQVKNTPTEGIRIAKLPDKRVYLQDELYSSTGMVVEFIALDGTITEIPIDKCKITGFDSSKAAENQTIKVSYRGYSATYTVTIKKTSTPAQEPYLIELITMPKTQYKVSELPSGVDAKGGVLRVTYTDGTTGEVELTDPRVFISGFMSINSKGEYTLTVSFADKGVRAKTTYTITVID